MKRQETKLQENIRELGIRRKFPLFFWSNCIKCEHDFRREWVWSIDSSYSIVCTSCAPSIDDAVSIVVEHMDAIRCPPMPPVKPPKKAIEKTLTLKDISDHIEKEVMSCLERNKDVKIDHLGRTKPAVIWGESE